MNKLNQHIDVDRLKERLQEFAKLHGVPEEQVLSLRLRPLQDDGSNAYPGWPNHEKAIELAGVERVPQSVDFFGEKYLPGAFTAYQPAQANILWVPHETGLELFSDFSTIKELVELITELLDSPSRSDVIGLILGAIGAADPIIRSIKWLINRLMEKPNRCAHQPYTVKTIQIEVRVLKDKDVYSEVLLREIERFVD